jgi:hypothetical protein
MHTERSDRPLTSIHGRRKETSSVFLRELVGSRDYHFAFPYLALVIIT